MRSALTRRRDGRSVLLYDQKTGLGVTLWRRGAVSLQYRGHFLQIVVGDWWKAMDGGCR